MLWFSLLYTCSEMSVLVHSDYLRWAFSWKMVVLITHKSKVLLCNTQDRKCMCLVVSIIPFRKRSYCLVYLSSSPISYSLNQIQIYFPKKSSWSCCIFHLWLHIYLLNTLEKMTSLGLFCLFSMIFHDLFPYLDVSLLSFFLSHKVTWCKIFIMI